MKVMKRASKSGRILGIAREGRAAVAAGVLGAFGAGFIPTADGAVVTSASASRKWVGTEIAKATNGLAKVTDVPTNVVQIGGIPAYRISGTREWYAGPLDPDRVGIYVDAFGVGNIMRYALLDGSGYLELQVEGTKPEFYSTNMTFYVDHIRRRGRLSTGQDSPNDFDYTYNYPAKSGTFAMVEDLDGKQDKLGAKSEVTVKRLTVPGMGNIGGIAAIGKPTIPFLAEDGTESDLVIDGTAMVTEQTLKESYKSGAFFNAVVKVMQPKDPVAAAAISYRADGTSIIVVVGAGESLTATTEGWPNAQAQTALITLASGAEVATNVKLVGYGSWPTERFLASCIRVDGNVYVNPITVVGE